MTGPVVQEDDFLGGRTVHALTPNPETLEVSDFDFLTMRYCNHCSRR
jgi:hypothetical protein